MTRVDPDRLGDERAALTQHLAYQRATMLIKLDGLDDEALRRPMTASGLNLLGLVRHLTVTEHGWLLTIYGGVPDPYLALDEQPGAEFRVDADEPTEEVLALYRETCARADELVAAGGLDDVVTTPWGAEVNLRAILAHLVQETARHNGHADLMREAIDGTTGS
ncbi:putative damage-inducible protein DinB [Nocardioides sp. BE266]|uniref:DinB family protein n=1 Tax=Nocardioides sp. BE266 TaxID=2817725 RepID=UPI00286477E4|nr:DinB family protein [Nocardioides sp. BE266]MDR7253572.1 putative damage-inducible protein DinB [Nocardioides sp. BE266]